MIFFKKPKQQIISDISVAYHWHNPSSGALIIYNLSNNIMRNLEITIENLQQSGFTYEINKIPFKTGWLLDYKNFPDTKQAIFNGEIKSVAIIIGEHVRYFFPVEKRFKQL